MSNIFDKKRLVSLLNDSVSSHSYSIGSNAKILEQRDSNLANLKGTYSVNRTEASIETLGDSTVTLGFDRLFETMGSFEYLIGSEDKEVKDFIEDQILLNNWSILYEGLGLSKLTGVSALEIIWGLDKGKVIVEDILPIDSKRIVFSQEENSYKYTPRFTTSSKPFDGELAPLNKIITHKFYSAYIDNSYGLGIGSLLVELVTIKQQLLELWLKLAGRYVFPIKVANVPLAATDEEVSSFFDCLKSMTNSSTFVLPEGYSLSVTDVSATGIDSILKPLLDYCDQQILGLIIGESITGKELSNGSNARDIQARDITHSKALSLAKDITATLNKTVVKWLLSYNFPSKKATIAVKSVENMAENLETYKALKELGLNIPPEFLAEKFGVPHVVRKKLGDSI